MGLQCGHPPCWVISCFLALWRAHGQYRKNLKKNFKKERKKGSPLGYKCEPVGMGCVVGAEAAKPGRRWGRTWRGQSTWGSIVHRAGKACPLCPPLCCRCSGALSVSRGAAVRTRLLGSSQVCSAGPGLPFPQITVIQTEVGKSPLL